MLESLRTNRRNVVITLLFLIIIFVFIVNFGPQSGGSEGGCSGPGSDHVLSVDDGSVSEASWRFANNTIPTRGAGRRALAMDLLLRREILAQAAESAGFRISDDAVDAVIKSGSFYLLGKRQLPGQPNYQAYFTDGFFDYRKLTGIARNWGLSIDQFRDQQRREMLADAWVSTIAGSALASRDEALAEFERMHTTAELDVVRFRPSQYAAALVLDDAALDGYVATHEAKVRAQYDADNERDYKGRKPEAKVRKIFVAKTAPTGSGSEPAAETPTDDAAATGADAPAAKPVETATPTPTDGAAAPAAKPTAKPEDDSAYGLLAAARASIVAGKRTFAEIATELSADPSSSKGGLIGWRKLDAPTLGATELNDALKTLEVGKVSEVIVAGSGFYLLLVEDKREGDLGFDQVKREIAEKMARDDYADENARRDALAAFDKARAGDGKTLESLFPREERPQQQITPELIEQLRQGGMTDEQIMQLLQGAGSESGSLTWESEDVPVSSMAWQNGDGKPVVPVGGTPPTKPAAAPTGDKLPAKPAAAPAGDKPAPIAAAPTESKPVAARRPAPPTAAAPGDKPAVAAPAAPTTTAAIPAAGAGSDAAASDDVMRAPVGEIPAPATPVEAKVVRIGPFTRDRENIAGLGKTPELIRAAFDELAAGQLAPRVYKVGNDYVVAQLISRTQADLVEFKKLEAEEIAEIAKRRGGAALETWVSDRCEKLVEAKKISPNLSLLEERDDTGKPLPVSYKPCELLAR